ncbi:hypothetical protein EJ06DRAFT_530707 [Trichodelitschia bisporula]|uniref:C2H2-type domain-containing protein n=1 Tax=Trichodelitschia bisporula TaxID=703511 RepID=A0A6G1HV91_9PEZI|nr:hypothetical protein EJ06DRAFT_530707 [Trichodelitschia bisporula]
MAQSLVHRRSCDYPHPQHALESEFPPFLYASDSLPVFSAPLQFSSSWHGSTPMTSMAYDDQSYTIFSEPQQIAPLHEHSLQSFNDYNFRPAVQPFHIPSEYVGTPAPSLSIPNVLSSRPSRAHSTTSAASFGTQPLSSPEPERNANSRLSSPGNDDISAYGHRNPQGTLSCSYPGCKSRASFPRPCDLRKHYKRHSKAYFCRHYPTCKQGFSSKKDLARHEAKHNPAVKCEWEGCDRMFSRVDNMRDHVKRIHKKSVVRRGSPAQSV